MHRETSELWNSSERPRKFPEIFGNSWIIFGNSDIWQVKNLTPLAQKKLAGIHLEKTTTAKKRLTESSSLL